MTFLTRILPLVKVPVLSRQTISARARVSILANSLAKVFLPAKRNTPNNKEAVVSNFARMGKFWIEGVFDWKGVLLLLAEMFARNGIEWYIIGSVGEAVRGVDIAPHDIDIGVHTRDFYKVRDLTREYVIEPLGDNKGNWIVRYFGKLCIDGASVDIAADEKLNMENRKYPCDRVSWSGYDLFVEPLQKRYEVELQRGREDRIRAMEEFMKRRA